MIDDAPDQIWIRRAEEGDASRIADLYYAVYGTGYVHPSFYDEHELKRMVFDENTLVLVAEDTSSGRLVGSAAVLFEMGAHTDLVGEFGRLVVHPDARGRGIGTRLMAERLAGAGGRLQVAYVEVRMNNQASPRISQRHGFVPVGLLPQKLICGENREHAGLLVKHFGDALGLRKNHPRMIPEAHQLAELALAGVGLQPDAIIDEDSAAYPAGASFELEKLTTTGYASLLRIQRGRVRSREIFGPQRLHYGLFKLAAAHSHYLVARDGARIVGALGYTRHDVERSVRVFELVHAHDDVIRFLFQALALRCEAENTMGVEIDVGAHAPRMQRTLLELGYIPNAYVPALAFDEVERVDVVKMYRLFEDLQDLPFDAPEPTRSVGQLVLDQFAARRLLPRLAKATGRLDICRGLTEEQSTRLLGEFASRTFAPGEGIFAQGEPPAQMILILEGWACVNIDAEPIGAVGPGESLGEISFLNGSDHSASAIAETEMEVGVLTRQSLEALVRRRPDIGTVVYQNLARGLGAKLSRADQAAVRRPTNAPPADDFSRTRSR